MNYEELYKFQKNKNGYTLKRFLMYNSAEITKLEIPSEYCSKPVTGIGGYAFAHAEFLRSVIIPDSVRKLGKGVFADCSSLTEVKLPKEITCIPTAMFEGCSSLKNIDLPESVTAIQRDAFSWCKSLEEVKFPKSLKLLDASFGGCTNLRSVVFQGKVNMTLFTFIDCPLLPAEVLLYSLIGANDLSEPITGWDFLDYRLLFKREVFALAVEHNCLRSIDKRKLFVKLIEHKDPALLPLSETLLTEDIADELIRFCTDKGMTEETAWLLDCKNRKFGFDVGEKYDL